jgi:zinc transport system substrate-binding protein
MNITRRTAAAFAAAGLVLAGCGSNDDATPEASGESGANGDGPVVLATFYPLAFIAEQVAGPDASVHNLTQPGVDAHDIELTGQQVGQIADADLVIYLHGFQPAVDEAIAQNAAEQAIDVMDFIDVLDDDGDSHAHEDAHQDEDDHAHENEDDHGHEEDHGHEDEDDHDHAHDLEGDPHIWQDPTNMAVLAEAIADALSDLDSDRAGDYHDRAHALADELDELDTEYQTRLATCERNVFVTSHAAFGYLAERYGLDMVGIASINPDAEPSPARLAEVQQVVQDEGLTTIFYERLVSPAVAEALANDVGVETAVLDPIEGLTDETADEDYFSLMRANLDALEEANGCS